MAVLTLTLLLASCDGPKGDTGTPTPTIALSAPGSFSISRAVKSPRNVTLVWSSSSDATSYTVKYGATSGSYPTTVSTNATSPFVVPNITGAFYFMVEAVNSVGTTAAASEKRAIESLAIGHAASHTCYLSDTGKVKCWGSNSSGQLGQGNTTNLGDAPNEMGSHLPEIDLGTGRTAVQIVGTFGAVCAILDNGSVKCWGAGTFGALGQGNTTNLGDNANEMGDNLTAVDLGTGRTAVQLSAGAYHVCALLDNATEKCWGYNSDGQLGQGNNNHLGDNPNEMGDNLPAIDLGTGRTVLQIASGAWSNCALLDNHTVKCWGVNTSGQLGLGNTTSIGLNPGEMGDSLPIVDLGTGRTALQVAAGDFESCALLDDNSMKCWGYNAYGELGQGDTSDRGSGGGQMGDNLPAIDLGTGRTAKQVSGGGNTMCALLDNAALKCWGRNQYGQMGKGDTTSVGNAAGQMGDNLVAIDLGSNVSVLQVAAGDQSCAILLTGEVKCWGRNDVGQLGYGDTNNLGDNAGEMGTNLSAVDLGF